MRTLSSPISFRQPTELLDAILGFFIAGADITDMIVLINGSTVLQHFNVSVAAAGPLKGYSRSFPVTVTDGYDSYRFQLELAGKLRLERFRFAG